MKKQLLIIFLFLGIFSTNLQASKLLEIKVIDKDYLLLIFRDGEVFYRDNATGPSAYRGHDFFPGDDTLKSYGNELNTEIASLLSSYTIISASDVYYSKGVNPLVIHRKSKVFHIDASYNYKSDHWIFLKLPSPLKKGANYTVKINPKTESDKAETSIVFDITNCMSEAIHVNINGYSPDNKQKTADLYLWLGDGGQRDYKSFEGKNVWLFNTENKKLTKVGKVKFWKSCQTKAESEGRNYTGSDVWTVDIENFNTPGKYRLVVEDVGCSMDFEIRQNIYFEPCKTVLRGYYYMRLGEDRKDLSPVPRRPLFIPEKDPIGFTVYLTDLQPFHPEWKAYRGDIWDEPHFKPALESMFWKHRLAGNPTNPNAYGGRSDAFDWDRHLGHVGDIYDILLPYILSGGKLNDDNLQIGESGNGIPDMIDEARNEVDMWLRLRDGDAYCHGLTNPGREHTVMFQAGATTIAAWANAANCAMIAEAFRLAGKTDLVEYYKSEAIKAFEFALKQKDTQLDEKQEVGDAAMRGRDFMMMAAAYLYNVTGQTKWEDIMAKESEAKDANSKIDNNMKWYQIWATAAYLVCPHKRNYPDLFNNMKMAIKNQAFQHNVQYFSLRPSRRSSNNNYWQTAENMQLVMLAHYIADNKADKSLFEQSMYAEADWGLGRNPLNTVEMTGLGQRRMENIYTTGRNDGTAGLHPGHTPYNNLDSWGKDHHGSDPRYFMERCYPKWISNEWPHQEGYFNCRYIWANAEFTPRQTMRGKMALYGYLYGISK